MVQVIDRTFAPFLEAGEALPPDLAPRLLQRFSSSEGYTSEPSLVSSLSSLKHRPVSFASRHFSTLTVGVVTNSDDRVPDVLSSFGLSVSPLRYSTDERSSHDLDDRGGYDIDFHCMSYDVGAEKPDRKIFEAAESLLATVVPEARAEDWLKVYVGDEHEKDVVGSAAAGWKPILLDPEGKATNFVSVEDHLDQTLEAATSQHSVLRVSSIRALANWLST